MAVTPADIAVELGRTAPVSPTLEQWQSWIDRTYRAIQRRAERLGVDYLTIDPDAVDDVVTYAVVRRATRPVDGAESATDQIGVDDGNWQRTRRFSPGMGDIHFLDEWWDLLGLTEQLRGAFSVRLAGEPDGPVWP